MVFQQPTANIYKVRLSLWKGNDARCVLVRTLNSTFSHQTLCSKKLFADHSNLKPVWRDSGCMLAAISGFATVSCSLPRTKRRSRSLRLQENRCVLRKCKRIRSDATDLLTGWRDSYEWRSTTHFYNWIVCAALFLRFSTWRFWCCCRLLFFARRAYCCRMRVWAANMFSMISLLWLGVVQFQLLQLCWVPFLVWLVFLFVLCN